MAQTVNLLAKFDWDEDGHELMSVYKKRESQSINNIQIYNIALDSNTSNYQVVFGSQFATVKHALLYESAGYTFTFSRDTTTTHQLVNANGFVMWEGDTTNLYLSNNNTDSGEEPTITIAISG